MNMSPEIVRPQELKWLVQQSPVSFWGWLIELCGFILRGWRPQPFAPNACLFNDSIITVPQYFHLTNCTSPLSGHIFDQGIASHDSAFSFLLLSLCVFCQLEGCYPCSLDSLYQNNRLLRSYEQKWLLECSPVSNWGRKIERDQLAHPPTM